MTYQCLNQRRNCITTSCSIAVGVVLAACLFSILRSDSQTPRAVAQAQPAAPADPQVTMGWQAHIDPKTGELTERPAQRPTSPPQVNSRVSVHDGLQERPSPVPGGGMILDLQGRFRSSLVARKGANGQVSIHHQGSPGHAGHSEHSKSAE